MSQTNLLEKYTTSIGIAFVLYNPPMDLIERIKICTSLGFQVFIFDNSETPSCYFNEISTAVHYTHNEKNLGLGYGLHSLGQEILSRNFDYMLFWDQDTNFNQKTLNAICLGKDKLKDFPNTASITFNSKNTNGVQETILSINSGTLFSLKALFQIGWHSKKIFVDCVDYDFCVKARRKGFVLRHSGPTEGLDHINGQDVPVGSIFGKKSLLLRKYGIRRVKTTIKETCKLILKSAVYFDIRAFLALLKFLLIYCLFQCLSRMNVTSKSS